MEYFRLPDCVYPLGSLMLALDVEHPLDDSGELESADDECEGPRAIDGHDLATGDGEVVGGLGRDLGVG